MVNWIEVDPEGLVKSSGPYHVAGEEMRTKSADLGQLGYSYWGCWGNDDEGNEFGDTLTDGLEKLKRKIDGTASRVNFVASGVEQNGVAYGNAEDAAVTVSQQTYDNNHTG